MTELEHSEMVKELKEHLAGVIQIVVNGKIDKLNEKVGMAIEKSDAAAQTSYHDSLERIKTNNRIANTLEAIQNELSSYKPIKEIYINVSGTGKVIKWIFVIITPIIGLLIGLKTLLKK